MTSAAPFAPIASAARGSPTGRGSPTAPLSISRTPDSAMPLGAGISVAPEEFRQVRARAIFECCKWDPQVGDVPVLAPFPLLLSEDAWREVAALAERLAAEAIEAEAELLGRPELHAELGLPWSVRRALRHASRLGPPPAPVRVMRFDFHWTPEGWRISEVNSDVPGGYVEASGFAALMAERYPGCHLPGDPARALAEAMLESCHAASASAPAAEPPRAPNIALVHATAYSDDHQVMVYLAGLLERAGAKVHLISPAQLRWRAGEAFILGAASGDENSSGNPAESAQRLDFLFRFFPAEWLPNLPRAAAWKSYFHSSRTPQCNPGVALLVQSKRFPLVWDRLRAPLSAWKSLLPPTFDPREVRWRDGSGNGSRSAAGGGNGAEEWVLKPALGRVGELIGIRGVTKEKEWKTIARHATWHPRYWAVQRRFEAVPAVLPETGELVYPCLGVYCVNGRAAGAYGRLASQPLIDFQARDAAVLIRSRGAAISATAASATTPTEIHTPSENCDAA